MKTAEQEWGFQVGAERAAANAAPVLSGIAEALAKAQCEMSNPVFDAQNPHFRNRFASLAAVRNAVVPVLAKHGIALNQDITSTDTGIACRTVLTHASGQQMVFGPLVLPVSKADAQGFGSAATYARRYSMMAVAGVVGDADDDGESAVTSRPDMKKAKEYADRFAQAIETGIDRAIYELHLEVTEDEELYRQTWSLLPSGMRRQIKEIIEREKAAK